MTEMSKKTFAQHIAQFIVKYAILVLLAAMAVSFFAAKAATDLEVSTDIGALMPEGSKSVQTLNKALKKTGSFASIQIVFETETPGAALDLVQAAKTEIDKKDWVASSQFSENIELFARHQLLLMSLEDLLELEKDINIAYPNLIAQSASEALGVEVSIEFREDSLTGNSEETVDTERIDSLLNTAKSPKKTEQFFASKDGTKAVLIVWPKPGNSSLIASKMMVDDSYAVVDALLASSSEAVVTSGIAGRIANQTTQFDAITNDLKVGLISAVTLIAILIALFYRSLIAIPAIFIPLALGILWTLGITAMTIGGLNLITAFLILILFGLGIDFGIHNYSRYQEERQNGLSIADALAVMIDETGRASFMAAVTTSSSFFALMLTEFRAFSEFGFIAGCGILMTLTAMYTVFPALIVIFEKIGLKPKSNQSTKAIIPRPITALMNNRKLVLSASVLLVVFSVIFAPQMEFESSTDKLEASVSPEFQAAKDVSKQVLKTGNSPAIVVAESYEQLLAIDNYFADKVKTDTDTPTIKSVSSLLRYVPDQAEQIERLKVIERLKNRADQLQGLDATIYEATKDYLSIEELNIIDLPLSLRRRFLGSDGEPGYLLYVEDSVDMDDTNLAKMFYDDVGHITIEDKSIYAASESFILLDMLSMMKTDALKAVSLVTLTTAFFVFMFLRSIRGTFIVLTPPIIGILFTVGIMGAFGPALSIMNMVILPSLVGISVDNGIHIYHRYEIEGAKADINKIMSTTGKAAGLTTLTTLIGFGGMITASMAGLRSMAVLAIIGFLSCLVMTWVLLPVLIQTFAKHKDAH